MSKLKKIDIFHFLSIFFAVVFLSLFSKHLLNFLVDIGREIYIPWQMAESDKILIKDFFIVFSPLSYQINAFLIKIFGSGLAVLSFMASICSILIVNAIYLIFNLFYDKKYSFLLTLCFTFSAIASTTPINAHFPYSFSIIYGLCCFCYSLYFLLKYLDKNSSKFLLVSSIFAGFSIAFKYEFLLYLFILFYFLVKEKKLKYLLFLILPIFLSYFVLFFQGLSLFDFLNYFKTLYAYINSESLIYFYKGTGTAFNFVFFIFSFFFLPFFLIENYFLYLALEKFKNKKKIRNILLILIYLLFAYFVFTFQKRFLFAFMPSFLIVLGLIYFKNFSLKLKVLYLSTILLALKSVFGMYFNTYSNYYSVFIFGVFYLILKDVVKKEHFKYYFLIFVIYLLSIIQASCLTLKQVNTKISFNNNVIYASNTTAKNTSSVLNYILNNTNKEDKILVLPQGAMINFLADRKSIDKYIALTPEYIEALKEEIVLNDLEKKPPKYVLLSNILTPEYKYSGFCFDYAKSICEFVSKNYKSVFDESKTDSSNEILFNLYKLK